MTLADIAARMGIKEKHIKMVLDTFKAESEPMQENLKEAVDQKNYEQIAYYAHAIKGSSGNLRFMELSDQAKEMEHAAKNEDAGFDYGAAYAKISEEFETIRKIDS